jgi:hypothetical protein
MQVPCYLMPLLWPLPLNIFELAGWVQDNGRNIGKEIIGTVVIFIHFCLPGIEHWT